MVQYLLTRIVVQQTNPMKLPILLTVVLLGLWACGDAVEKTAGPAQSPIASWVKAIDQEVADIEKDETCAYISQPMAGTEGTQLNARLRQGDLVMIEEEEISAQQAKINRYYYKDQQLVFAAEYQVNACADTIEVCVNETRCYFQEDQLICEYVRSVSIPLNEEGWLDKVSWDDYLNSVVYQSQPVDQIKTPTILERSIQLRSNFSNTFRQAG